MAFIWLLLYIFYCEKDRTKRISHFPINPNILREYIDLAIDEKTTGNK